MENPFAKNPAAPPRNPAPATGDPAIQITPQAPPAATEVPAPASPPVTTPPPAAPVAAPAAPPPVAAAPLPGGFAPPPPAPMPGMKPPSAASPGAGKGAPPEGFAMKPAAVVRGRYAIRPIRWIPVGGKMKNPAFIFEVHDEGERAKAAKGQPQVEGAEIMVTIWTDRGDDTVFAALGYPASAVSKDAQGYPIFPIAEIVRKAPLVWADIDQVEGNTPGRTFPKVSWGQLISRQTKGQG